MLVSTNVNLFVFYHVFMYLCIYAYEIRCSYLVHAGKTSTSDLRELCVPGRVFFIKPRKLKEVGIVR